MAAAITPMQCECGSTFFYTARAEQFQAGGFGTAEFRSISNAPKTILICLCGKPVIPKPTHYARGTVAHLAEEDFKKSVEAAQKYRKDHSLEHVAQIAASPAELSDVQKQIDDLKKVVEDLPKTASKKSKENPDARAGSKGSSS